jgi:hypothetical protein
VFAVDWDKKHPGEPPQLMGQLFHLFESPNRFGLPAFYTLHVWAWKDNPNGAFVNWRPNVSCDKFNAQNPWSECSAGCAHARAASRAECGTHDVGKVGRQRLVQHGGAAMTERQPQVDLRPGHQDERDGHGHRVPLQVRAQLVATATGHVQVAQDDVWRRRANGHERLEPITGFDHVKATAAEQGRNDRPDGLVVIDQQDPGGIRRGSACGGGLARAIELRLHGCCSALSRLQS